MKKFLSSVLGLIVLVSLIGCSPISISTSTPSSVPANVSLKMQYKMTDRIQHFNGTGYFADFLVLNPEVYSDEEAIIIMKKEKVVTALFCSSEEGIKAQYSASLMEKKPELREHVLGHFDIR